MTAEAAATRRPRWGRRVAITLACVLALVILAGVWVGVRAVLAKNELEAVLPLATPVREAAQARDLDRLDSLLAEVESHASQAASLTGDPIWRAAEILPWVGSNMAAVRTVSAAVDDVSSTARPLIEMAASAASGDQAFDMNVLASAAPALTDAAEAFTTARADLADLARDDLIPVVSRGVESVDEVVSGGTPLVTTLADAARILPPMLGVDEPRTLLVMLQNSAELRTAGGIAGSFVLLEASDGDIRIVDQADDSSFPVGGPATAAFPASTEELYGEGVGQYIQNSTMTPDFAVTGEMVSAWWQEAKGVMPDAVLSLDIPAIAALLSTTGPLLLPDGSELPPDRLVDAVLVELYFQFDRDLQTPVQQAVAGAAMARIFGAAPDPLAWAQAMMTPIDEGRLSAWSADAEEQAVIADSFLGGPAARLAQHDGDAFAVYFNDATAGKMDPYLDVALAAASTVCRSDGRQDLVLTVTLTNTAPAESVDWPWWITGGGIEGVAPGDIATNVAVAAPDGVVFSAVRVDDEIVPTTSADDAGSPTTAAEVTVAPGGTRVIEFRYVEDEAEGVAFDVLHTPLMRAATWAELEAGCR